MASENKLKTLLFEGIPVGRAAIDRRVFVKLAFVALGVFGALSFSELGIWSYMTLYQSVRVRRSR